MGGDLQVSHTQTHAETQDSPVCWTMRKTAASLFQKNSTTVSAYSTLPWRRGCEKEKPSCVWLSQVRTARPRDNGNDLFGTCNERPRLSRERDASNIQRASTTEKQKGKLHMLE